MNWKTRLRLFVGIILVGIVASGMTMYVDTQRSLRGSKTAEIGAALFGVGTDYTGLVTKQLVQEGDKVTAGQTLFQVKSSMLIEQIRDSELSKEELIYPLSDDNEILLKAPRDGIVATIFYGEGAF